MRLREDFEPASGVERRQLQSRDLFLWFASALQHASNEAAKKGKACARAAAEQLQHSYQYYGSS